LRAEGGNPLSGDQDRRPDIWTPYVQNRDNHLKRPSRITINILILVVLFALLILIGISTALWGIQVPSMRDPAPPPQQAPDAPQVQIPTLSISPLQTVDISTTSSD
jgi:hypothetical protein